MDERFTMPSEAAGRRKDSSFSAEEAARPRSRFDFSKPPRIFLGNLVFMLAESTRTTAGTSAAGSGAVSFLRPAVFLAKDEVATSSLTITFPLEPRVDGNKAELLWISEAFFFFSFLDSRLFSFSLSRSLSRLFSFSGLLSLSLSLDGSSAALSLLLDLSVCGPGANQGKRGAVPLDGNGSAGRFVCFLGL